MTEIAFTCQVLSPMFLGNANTMNAELRPSALKASLRFWWRAIHPQYSVQKLKEAECNIFGGSCMVKNEKDEYVEKTFPAAFKLVQIAIDAKPEKLDVDPRTQKEMKNYIDSIDDTKKKKNYIHYLNTKICAIPTNSNNTHTTFKVTFLCRPGFEKHLAHLMFLASFLGGLGKRSRRGAGAWCIKEIEGATDFNLTYSLKNLLETIKTLNTYCPYELAPTNNSIILKQEEKVSIPHNAEAFPYIKNITIGNNALGEKAFRKKIMHTAHTVKHQNNLFKEYLGNAFGGRLASPVYVSAIPSIDNPNKLVPAITTLNHKTRGTNIKEGQALQETFIEIILNNS